MRRTGAAIAILSVLSPLSVAAQSETAQRSAADAIRPFHVHFRTRRSPT